MINQLSNQELKFDVEVKTSVEMKNEEQLNALVTEVESKMAGLVFTDENVPEAKETRASLNKIIKQLDTGRKGVKNEALIPVTAFENKMKEFVKRLNNVISPIDSGIKDFEEAQKANRKLAVEKLINESAINFEIEPSEVVIQESWLIKSLSDIKRTKLVTDEMTRIQQEKQKLANELSIIASYCKALNLDDGGWLLQINQGVPSPEVMKSIDEYNQREKERIERDKQLENDRLAKIEQEKLVKQSQVEVTKEPVSHVEVESHRQELASPAMVTLTLKFTGTESQLTQLSDFIKTIGINVEKL